MRAGLLAVSTVVVAVAACGRSGPRSDGDGTDGLVRVALEGAGRVTSDPFAIDCIADGGTCAAVFPEGTRVVLIASGGEGVVLATWSGCTPDPGDSDRCSVVVSGERDVAASFLHRLRVSLAGAPIGSVSDGAQIDCGSACEAWFPPGQEVTLTAVLTTSASVLWDGCEAAAALACESRMDQPREVSAGLYRSGDVVWAFTLGGTGGDVGHGVTADTAGNVVVVGVFEGTVDLGEGPETAVNRDAFVLSRAAADGAAQWARVLTGSAEERAFATARLPDGKVGIAGQFNGTELDLTSTGGGTLSNANGFDPFVVAIQPSNATFAWYADVDAQSGDDLCHALAPADPWRGAIAGGERPGDGVDGFVLVIDSAGKAAAPIVFSGDGTDVIRSVAALPDGSVLAAGHMTGSLTVEVLGIGVPLSSNGGSEDLLTIGVDPVTGDTVWAEVYGGTANDRIEAAATGGGATYVAGFIAGAAPIDVGDDTVTSAGAQDVFIARLTTAGDVVWARAYGGVQADAAAGVAANDQGVFVAGRFRDDATFGNVTLEGPDKRNIFVARLSPDDGSVVWARGFWGTTDLDEAMAIALDPQGFVLVTGYVSSEIDFGTGLLPHEAGNDVFVLKLAP